MNVPSDLFGNPIKAPTRKPGRPKGSTPIEGLKVSDLCHIIRTCSACNVSRLQFSDVQLEFAAGVRVVNPTEQESIGAGCSPISDAELESQGRHDSLQALGDRVEEELEMLKITDPVRYEKFLVEDQGDK